MLNTLKRFDALLRGELGFDSEKQTAAIQVPVFRIVLLSILMAMIFGASIGSFSAVSASNLNDGLNQLLASTVKAPLLFYLTLIVIFPSLYDKATTFFREGAWGNAYLVVVDLISRLL